VGFVGALIDGNAIGFMSEIRPVGRSRDQEAGAAPDVKLHAVRRRSFRPSMLGLTER